MSFGSSERSKRFLLVEGKCPKFYKFELRLLRSYKGKISIVWEDNIFYMKVGSPPFSNVYINSLSTYRSIYVRRERLLNCCLMRRKYIVLWTMEASKLPSIKSKAIRRRRTRMRIAIIITTIVIGLMSYRLN